MSQSSKPELAQGSWRTSRKLRDNLSGYSFIAPVTVLFTMFYYIPLVRTIQDGFYQFNIVAPQQRTFVGISNYRQLVASGDFALAIARTGEFTLFYVFFSTAVALVLAVLMNQNIRGRTVYRTLYFLPVIAPTVATSIVFTNLFYNDKTGVVNHILSWFHIGPVAWLGDPHFAMATVVVYSVWTAIGYNMVIYLAGLQAIPSAYYEAARIDGAGPWSLFRKITLPLLGPTTLFVVIVGVIGGFQVFNQIYIMTQGGPLNATTVVLYYIYQTAFVYFQGGAPSAMSTVLFVILLVLTIAQLRIFRSKD